VTLSQTLHVTHRPYIQQQDSSQGPSSPSPQGLLFSQQCTQKNRRTKTHDPRPRLYCLSNKLHTTTGQERRPVCLESSSSLFRCRRCRVCPRCHSFRLSLSRIRSPGGVRRLSSTCRLFSNNLPVGRSFVGVVYTRQDGVGRRCLRRLRLVSLVQTSASLWQCSALCRHASESSSCLRSMLSSLTCRTAELPHTSPVHGTTATRSAQSPLSVSVDTPSTGCPYLTLPYLRGGQVVTPAQR